MARYRDPDPEELEESRDPRVARRQLDRLEVAAHHLEQAGRAHRESGRAEDPALEQLIERVQNECADLHSRLAGRVESRRRPKKPSGTRETCTVFIDECGQHSMKAKDAYPVFVLAAAIVRDSDLGVVEAEWRRWKREKLGSEDAIVHEPDVRKRTGPFRRTERGDEAIATLPDIISALDFSAVVVVVHRPNYVEDFGLGRLDESLPAHGYMMALDFLLERLAFVLDSEYDGAIAQIVAESRGPKEDAMLQYEAARLQLEGTSYVSDAWFRQQFRPGIHFFGKSANSTGLQLADLLARPVGDRVIDPLGPAPDRWAVFRPKLCQGQETKNSITGLKILPWREQYEQLWKS